MFSEILKFLDFGNLARKCLLMPLFMGFGDTFSQMMSLIVLTPKERPTG